VEHRELQDLIPAHALDALEADDAVQLEAHIESCPECRRELDELRETTALLAFATDPVEPPASLRAAILDAVAEPVPARTRPRVRLAFLRGAFAGTLAGAAIALVIGIALHSQLDNARSSRDAQRSAVSALLQSGSQVEALKGNVQGANVQGAVVRNGGVSKLVLLDLPKPAAGRTYEAWLIGADKKPAPAGTFSGGKTVLVSLAGNAATTQTVAITVEPAGGSQAPTSAPVASASFA
jgi:anti-sigma-K factor RskA